MLYNRSIYFVLSLHRIIARSPAAWPRVFIYFKRTVIYVYTILSARWGSSKTISVTSAPAERYIRIIYTHTAYSYNDWR